MNFKEKITVITPTFNRAHTLNRVYESLLRQSFKDFKWVIMDDGSTDHTEEVIRNFINDNQIKIEYYKNPNHKKFYTVFKAIKNVTTPYFTIIDSDDAYLDDALEILIREADQLNPNKFISVIGHSVNQNGKLVGTLFPFDFDGSILQMRYKYKVRGDKNGLFITKPYLEFLENFDFEKYKNKYAPQRIFFQIYDAIGLKTRFINKAVRIYYYDLSDTQSMSNDRIKPSSYEGLTEGHLSFLNAYGNQLFFYPKALLRNLIGYQTYAIKSGRKTSTILTEIKNPLIKILGFFALPFSFIYQKLK